LDRLVVGAYFTNYEQINANCSILADTEKILSVANWISQNEIHAYLGKK
jgi:hypothetical protein